MCLLNAHPFIHVDSSLFSADKTQETTTEEATLKRHLEKQQSGADLPDIPFQSESLSELTELPAPRRRAPPSATITSMQAEEQLPDDYSHLLTPPPIIAKSKKGRKRLSANREKQPAARKDRNLHIESSTEKGMKMKPSMYVIQLIM